MKLSAIAVIILLVMLVVGLTAVLLVGEFDSQFDDRGQSGLFIESFSHTTIGSKVTGGSIAIVNPTDKNFENLTLTFKVDDSEPIVPFLRLLKPLHAGEPFSNHSILITTINIAPNQNVTVQLYLFDPEQNEPPFYETIVDIQTFSSHVVRFYLTQNVFGDVVNGQTFTIPQEKTYLQIIDYSPIEHSTDTWHEYYNNSKKRYEYVNDQPNYYQRSQAFFPLDPDSYNWAKSLNQIGEHYFNVTILNNCTFPVKGITLYGSSPNGEDAMAFAAADTVLQPNAACILAVQAGGENWWSVEAVYQLSNFSPAKAFASGDLIDNQK